jgi:hypothetical protein
MQSQKSARIPIFVNRQTSGRSFCAPRGARCLPTAKSRSSSANRFRDWKISSRDRLCYDVNRPLGIGTCPVATADPILRRFRAALHELYATAWCHTVRAPAAMRMRFRIATLRCSCLTRRVAPQRWTARRPEHKNHRRGRWAVHRAGAHSESHASDERNSHVWRRSMKSESAALLRKSRDTFDRAQGMLARWLMPRQQQDVGLSLMISLSV